MTEFRGRFDSLDPSHTVSWSDQPGSTYYNEIEALEIAGPFERVRQRETREWPATQALTIGSQGFRTSSGLLLYDPAGERYMFSHIMPQGVEFARRLGKSARRMHWQEPRQGVLLYGDKSREQADIAHKLKSGFWGPTDLEQVMVPTGKDTWAVVFNGLTRRLSITSKRPTRLVYHYDLFASDR